MTGGVAPNNTTAQAAANWAATTKTVVVADDPWIFTPDDSEQLTVEVTLEAVDLEVQTDSPSESGYASIEVDAAFGTGDQTGQNIVAEDSWHMEITTGSFTMPSMTLIGQTFNLAAGTVYWETVGVVTLGALSGGSGSGGSPSQGTNSTTTTVSISGAEGGQLTYNGQPTSSMPFGQPVTITANVSAVGTPTGTVSFYNGSTFLGTGTLDNTGAATLVTSALPIGTDSVIAVYNGDNSFASSTSAAVSQTVTQGTTTISVDSSNDHALYGQPVTLNALVSTITGTPTGTVSFHDRSTLLGTAPVDQGRIAVLTTTALTVASHSATAVYGGDSNFAGRTWATLSQAVSADSADMLLASSSASAAGGTAVTFTATVSDSNGVALTSGTVSFYVDGVFVGTVNLSNSGTASITLDWLSVGTHQITACYSSDGLTPAAFSDPFQQTITQ